MDEKLQRERDANELAKMGYSQELERGLGGFSNFAVAFSVISILTGISQLYGYGLQHGGPLQLFVGWLLVGGFTLMVALSMAELASSYPTAGALYHWASFLGGRTVGWITACCNTVGMFALVAGIDFGLAKFIIPLLHLNDDSVTSLVVYFVILFSHAFLNARGIKWVAWLNDFSAVYQVGVVALLIGLLAWKGVSQPVSFLLKFQSVDGYPPAYSFLIGLLLAQWTLSGYDASAHVTEETVDPGRRAPWGIFLSVVLSLVFGLLMLIAVTLSIKDLDAVTKLGDGAFLEICRLVLGDALGRVLVFLVAGAMWLCGLASVTSASRMIFAFARDGGLPFSKFLSRVGTKHQVPANAIWLLSGTALFLAVSVKVYSAVVSIATIALYLSYGIPIAARVYVRLSGRHEKIGPWSLGRFSTPVSVVALVWIIFITTVFVLPPNDTAGLVMLACLAVLVVLWFFYISRRFAGPKYKEESCD